jgi:hypothetical protein
MQFIIPFWMLPSIADVGLAFFNISIDYFGIKHPTQSISDM